MKIFERRALSPGGGALVLLGDVALGDPAGLGDAAEARVVQRDHAPIGRHVVAFHQGEQMAARREPRLCVGRLVADVLVRTRGFHELPRALRARAEKLAGVELSFLARVTKCLVRSAEARRCGTGTGVDAARERDGRREGKDPHSR